MLGRSFFAWCAFAFVSFFVCVEKCFVLTYCFDGGKRKKMKIYF
jgi:hypothetical protein